MNATPTTRHHYNIVPAPRRKVVAVCTCGWRSEPTTAGGMAGSQFDRHYEETHS